EFVLTGCVIDGDTLGIVTDVGEKEAHTPLALTASPNPCSASTTFRFALPAGVTSVRLTLTDIFGRMIHTTDLHTDSYTFDTSTLPGGLYFCTLTAGAATETSKLVIYR